MEGTLGCKSGPELAENIEWQPNNKSEYSNSKLQVPCTYMNSAFSSEILISDSTMPLPSSSILLSDQSISNPFILPARSSWDMIENWRNNSTVHELQAETALHSGQMTSNSFTSTSCPGFYQNVLAVMHPQPSAFREAAPCRTWQETVTSPKDIRSLVNLCDPTVNNIEQKLSSADIKSHYNGDNYLSGNSLPNSISSCLEYNSENLQQSGFHASTAKTGKVIQQNSVYNSPPAGFIVPNLEAENPCNGYLSTAVNPFFFLEDKSHPGLVISNSIGCFSNPQSSEQNIPSVDGHILPSSMFESVNFSHCNVLPFNDTSASLVVNDMNTAASGSSLTTMLPATQERISFNTARTFSRADNVAGSHSYSSVSSHGKDVDLGPRNAVLTQMPNNPIKLSTGFSPRDDKVSNSHKANAWQTESRNTSESNSVQTIHIDNSVRHDDCKEHCRLHITSNSPKRTYMDFGQNYISRPMKKSPNSGTSTSTSNNSSTDQKLPNWTTDLLSSVPSKNIAATGRAHNMRSRPKQSSANDPQSIAARHRRERISERLKILQDLVPNGSKVDLVTMLEKAINYVKFLQLQVKVLTTDEYWPTQHGGPNILQVQDALQAIASRSRTETEGASCTTKVEKTKTENLDNP